jgi:hypothetical protein
MPKITIELGEERELSHCECCGNVTRSVHGFLYKDNDAYAVYFASWTDNHKERVVTIAIGLGEWGDNATEEDRFSVGLNAWSVAEQKNFAVIEPSDSPWGATKFIGRMMSRDSVLASPEKEEFFHVAEHIVNDDPRIKLVLE